jgi:hypothetical protein
MVRVGYTIEGKKDGSSPYYFEALDGQTMDDFVRTVAAHHGRPDRAVAIWCGAVITGTDEAADWTDSIIDICSAPSNAEYSIKERSLASGNDQ